MNGQFRSELVEGEIHFRDRYQFELKSEFFPDPKHGKTVFSQEFYLFLPTSLQVNPDTYSKAFFYQDQTELIRQKTPELDLVDLLNSESNKNPLAHIESLLMRPPSDTRVRSVIQELKMLGNIYRSSLRRKIHVLVQLMESKDAQQSQGKIRHGVDVLIDLVGQVETRLAELTQLSREGEWASHDIAEHFRYVRQFMTQAEDKYFTGLLNFLRNDTKQKHFRYLASADKKLVEFLERVDQYHYNSANKAQDSETTQAADELFEYERGLLSKYVLDSLLLDVERQLIFARYTHYIGSFAAALAMFFYLALFMVNSHFLVTNSTPFILASIVLYVLKDRIKEGVKLLWLKGAGTYFPDYRTEIRLPQQKAPIGELLEYFTFLPNSRLPDDIVAARKKERKRVLEAFERPENVIYARKHLVFSQNVHAESGDHPLNMFFRFSVQRFLEKLSDPDASYTTLDQATGDLAQLALPKVYHLNIVVKSKVIKKSGENEAQIRKYRIILNKLGIKRVERLF